MQNPYSLWGQGSLGGVGREKYKLLSLNKKSCITPHICTYTIHIHVRTRTHIQVFPALQCNIPTLDLEKHMYLYAQTTHRVCPNQEVRERVETRKWYACSTHGPFLPAPTQQFLPWSQPSLLSQTPAKPKTVVLY